MGVDVKVTLPPDTRLQDVADAIARLAGYPCTRHSIGENGQWALHQKEVTAKGSIIPQMAYINWAWAGEPRSWAYHFEGKGGTRLLISRSRAVNIAVAKRLVDIFGGAADYNDSDGVDVDYHAPKPRPANDPEDGVAWQQLQQDLLDISPLTKQEVAQYQTVASYK